MGIFPNIGGGGSPHSQNFFYPNHTPKKPLKHLKIPQKFPTLPKKNRQKMVKIPKRGGWGPLFGKNSQIIPYFFLMPSLIIIIRYRHQSMQRRGDTQDGDKSGLTK